MHPVSLPGIGAHPDADPYTDSRADAPSQYYPERDADPNADEDENSHQNTYSERSDRNTDTGLQ